MLISAAATEIAVISLSGVVNWRSIPIAGDELTKNIINTLETFNLLLGERAAEQVKIQVGSACPLAKSIDVNMRGRDLISGLPKEILVSDGQIREAMYRSIRVILENIKATLEVTPPELVADIYERGITLTGGGALLRGMDEIIAKEAAIPVHIVDDPLTAVVRGAGVL